MSKKTDIWMPLFVGDYLADTIGLSREQHGAYLLALCAYWRKGSALTVEELQEATGPCYDRISKFFQLQNGLWTQKRIEIELAKADHRKDQATQNIQKRWNKAQKDTPVLPANNGRNTEPIPNGYSSPSPSVPTNVGTPIAPELALDGGVENPKSDAFDQFWAAYPKKIAKPKAEKAFKRQSGEANLAAILTAIASHAKSEAWTKDGGQFIPYPATWLNQKRWEDQPNLSSFIPKLSQAEQRRQESEWK